MNKLFLFIAFFFLSSCHLLEEERHCESGHGYLQKDGMEFVCPFTIQERKAKQGGGIEYVDYYGGVTAFRASADDYEPLKHKNTPYTYRLKMNGSKKYFTEEQYAVSLWIVDKNFKICGEAREFVFYKVIESSDSVEYLSRVYTDDTAYGKYVFFAEREMPSYDWYHVLNIGKCKDFYIKGEIVK
ncbi:MAG: hypothetical protein LBC87_06760 [Fibromonadaceae bacterium]|jgi:hypothetical protein|nr:hypothetical protein [Fibromonadaceae bacterium]